MAAFKNILRSFIVMGLILGVGFFGLWILSEKGGEIKITRPNDDPFYDVGGTTPQETLSRFISALEKNDLVSAINYFIPENRETESEDLAKLYRANFLGDLIKDLKTVKNGKEIDGSHYRFEVVDLTDSVAPPTVEIELVKNAGGFWKIISL